jgi:hypothetical protein
MSSQMTLGIAWVGTRSDGREDLYIASDSRTRGAWVQDFSPKILTLPRSGCAICFAGDTFATYPLMLQLSNAIAAHLPARERNMDIAELKAHMLRVFSDWAAAAKDKALEFAPDDAQFIFGGYSWRGKGFRLWTVYYEKASKRFHGRESCTFHGKLKTVAFIGDRANDFRGKLTRMLQNPAQEGPVELEPLTLLAKVLRESKRDDTIGGAPQVVRISPT